MRRASGSTCAACGHHEHAIPTERAGPYAYLLGLYLGDGCISSHPRGVFRLRIALDARYPQILDECEAAIRALMPGRSVARVNSAGYVEVGAYSKAWPCLLPQHGPGRKHERTIRLRDWQRHIVDEHARPLLRGLIHSDGCRVMNRVRSPAGKWYAYPRYQFSNRSDDIRRIFTDTCDRIGVQWRQMNRWNVSVARRASVDLLDAFIGPKR